MHGVIIGAFVNPGSEDGFLSCFSSVALSGEWWTVHGLVLTVIFVLHFHNIKMGDLGKC